MSCLLCRVGHHDFVVSANEGDGRDYPGFTEEGKITSAGLDPIVFPNAAPLADKAALGRLTVVGAPWGLSACEAEGGPQPGRAPHRPTAGLPACHYVLQPPSTR